MCIRSALPLALTLCFLLTSAGRVQAGDDPADVVTERGFSIRTTDLRRMRLNPQDLTVLTAYLDKTERPHHEANRLEIEILKDTDPAREQGFLVRGFGDQGAEVMEREATTLRGRPATRVLLRHPDGRRILLVHEDEKRKSGAWVVRAHCGGEQADVHLERVERALATLSRDAAPPPPEGVFRDRVHDFRIRLEGFEGATHGFQLMLLGMWSYRVEGEHAGTLVLSANWSAETRAEAAPRLRSAWEDEGYTVESLEKVEHEGHPALRLRAARTQEEGRQLVEELRLWDRGVVWSGRAHGRGDRGATWSAPPFAALRSLRLVAPLPAGPR